MSNDLPVDHLTFISCSINREPILQQWDIPPYENVQPSPGNTNANSCCNNYEPDTRIVQERVDEAANSGKGLESVSTSSFCCLFMQPICMKVISRKFIVRSSTTSRLVTNQWYLHPRRFFSYLASYPATLSSIG